MSHDNFVSFETVVNQQLTARIEWFNLYRVVLVHLMTNSGADPIGTNSKSICQSLTVLKNQNTSASSIVQLSIATRTLSTEWSISMLNI